MTDVERFGTGALVFKEKTSSIHPVVAHPVHCQSLWIKSFRLHSLAQLSVANRSSIHRSPPHHPSSCQHRTPSHYHCCRSCRQRCRWSRFAHSTYSHRGSVMSPPLPSDILGRSCRSGLHFAPTKPSRLAFPPSRHHLCQAPISSPPGALHHSVHRSVID